MASSQRKTDSARANGAKSRGPVTPEGRQNSALANMRHGLTARTVCLTNESQPKFIALLQGYIDHFDPVGPAEEDLIEAMTVAKWQEQRMWAIHTATLDHRMEFQAPQLEKTYKVLDEPTRLALAWAESAKESNLALQLRYANSHRRVYEKSLLLLLKLQAGRTEPVPQVPGVFSPTEFPNEPSPENEHLPDPPAQDPNTPVEKLETDSAKEPNPTNEHPLIELLACVCGRVAKPQLGPEPILCECGRIMLQPSAGHSPVMSCRNL